MNQWEIFHGDCIPHMARDMNAASVDLAIFSPPFPSLFAYSSDEADIGNTDTVGAEAKIHLSFFYKALARVLKPGRVACVHVCQIPRMKRSGGVGLCDFRGINIRIGERAGLVYEYDWLIPKNPQAQAIRTRSRELQFSGLESDRAKTRGTLADYIIKFRAPGENAVPIDSAGQVSRNQWIEWAEAAWTDIRETKTPFAGIGSEGYVALKLDRRFYGCELKQEYHAAASRTLAAVVADSTRQPSLFGEEVDCAS